MARAKSKGLSVVATDKHWLRLVQQVAPGTPGAYVDPIFGRSWIASAKAGPKQGLNGKGGFIQVESDPILNDTSQIVVTLPPTGSDGRDNRDRLYFYSDSPDPQNPGQIVGYMAGDEWFELYRGNAELVDNGTPVSEQGQPGQIAVTCRDCVQPLQKSNETQAGLWWHAPRDVFEHYTRCWLGRIADDFTNPAAFPATQSFTPGTSSDGRWDYTSCYQSPLGSSFVRIEAVSTHSAALTSTAGIEYGPTPEHSCWRVEASAAAINGHEPSLALLMLNPAATGEGNLVAALGISPQAGVVGAATLGPAGVFVLWQVSTAGLLDPTGNLSAPVALAIECRERWCYFYVNGQLVAVGAQPWASEAITLTPALRLAGEPDLPFHFRLRPTPGDAGPDRTDTTSVTADIDYLVCRQTSVPMNGGEPGDYFLPSPPDAGGLTGQYFDQSSADYAIADPTLVPVATRTDSGVWFQNPAGWMPFGVQQATLRYVRWSGAIYLPLADQDVHFTIPPVSAGGASLKVGRTRDGEAACISGEAGPGEPYFPWELSAVGGGRASVGMRSVLGEESGWYPVVFEYVCDFAADPTDTSIIGFAYDVDAGALVSGGGLPAGSWYTPGPDVLSPNGLVTQQVTGSHYTELQTLNQQFAIQWRSEPMPLESGWFPGMIVPRARIGRDTDKVLTEPENMNPQSQLSAEDGATTCVGSAQGLGGNSAGQILAEAFNFPVLLSHPYVSTETENLPSVTDQGLLALQLESLLALRSEVWEQIQTTVLGQRGIQDTFPLSGALKEFDWQPGDALRRDLPTIGIDDTDPIPIMSLQRILMQDGMSTNQVSFAQRPRDFRRTMLKFIRGAAAAKRVFQGQLAYIDGTVGEGDISLSQVAIPQNLQLVRQAVLVVMQKADSSAWAVYINGQPTGQTVSNVTTVDVSDSIAYNNGTDLQMTAALASGSGTVFYQLRLTVLIPQA